MNSTMTMMMRRESNSCRISNLITILFFSSFPQARLTGKLIHKFDLDGKDLALSTVVSETRFVRK